MKISVKIYFPVVLGLLVFFAGTAGADYSTGEYDAGADTAGLWHLNEQSGTVIYDETTNGYSGTFDGHVLPTWDTGLLGGGIHTSCYYDANVNDGSSGVRFNYPILNQYNTWTLEMYLKWEALPWGPAPGDPGFAGYLAQDPNTGNGNMFVRGYIEDNVSPFKCSLTFGLHCYDQPGWEELDIYGTQYTLDANRWHHVAFVAHWNPSPGNMDMSIYVDGELAAFKYTANGTGLWGGDLEIGRPTNASNTCAWGGTIDEIRISNTDHRDFYSLTPVYHVDAVDGNDNNDGLTQAKAFKTIQTGINTANGYEMIKVWPGVYSEELDFLGKEVMVTSAAEPAVLEAPIVDPAHYPVWFHSNEGPRAIFRNFIVRNSYTAFAVSFAEPTISNVTVVDNEVGIYADNADPHISNSIFWNNTFGDLWDCQATYSCIESGDPGLGNISEEPMFADPNNGDYRLKSQGWRWDVDSNDWTSDGVTSRCIDAGNPGLPLRNELLTVPPDANHTYGENLRINMGAYGGTASASMPPYDWALLSDLNNDGMVDGVDYALQAKNWLKSAKQQPSDLNHDKIVNIMDIESLAEDWLQTASWAE